MKWVQERYFVMMFKGGSKMSFLLIPHVEEFKNLTLHDTKAVIKYAKLSHKLERDIA